MRAGATASHPQARRRRRGLRPRLEAMEPRRLPASFLVTTTADGGAGSLRQAITDANAKPGPDAIGFALPAENIPGVVDYNKGYGFWRIHVPIEALAHRVQCGGVREVILATNPTLEGDGTAMLVAQRLADFHVAITRLARGLASGSSLEFANREMLADALAGRREF